jgi:hypothetical protein
VGVDLARRRLRRERGADQSGTEDTSQQSFRVHAHI